MLHINHQVFAVIGFAFFFAPAVALKAEMTDADQKMIGGIVGSGVVGPEVAGQSTDAILASGLVKESTSTYRIVSGPGKGSSITHEIKKAPLDRLGTEWRIDVGPKNTYFLGQNADGSVTVAGERDGGENVAVRYTPPQPILPAGLAPGAERQETIAVEVYDLGDLTDLSYRGTLKLTYSNLGTYQVTVPAGTFEAVLVKWVYKGKIGPASIEDIQYRFFAPGSGMVALVEKKDISAMLIYNDQSKIGKILESRSN
jgi:hypothetical protein